MCGLVSVFAGPLKMMHKAVCFHHGYWKTWEHNEWFLNFLDWAAQYVQAHLGQLLFSFLPLPDISKQPPFSIGSLWPETLSDQYSHLGPALWVLKQHKSLWAVWNLIYWFSKITKSSGLVLLLRQGWANCLSLGSCFSRRLFILRKNGRVYFFG